MQLTGNTILITGGGSGIGRGLAEALHQRKNQVIISGRRKDLLIEVAKASPGMAWVELDIEDPASISAVAAKLISEYQILTDLTAKASHRLVGRPIAAQSIAPAVVLRPQTAARPGC
jgi:uncharacterized oxidoreductase